MPCFRIVVVVESISNFKFHRRQCNGHFEAENRVVIVQEPHFFRIIIRTIFKSDSGPSRDRFEIAKSAAEPVDPSMTIVDHDDSYNMVMTAPVCVFVLPVEARRRCDPSALQHPATGGPR